MGLFGGERQTWQTGAEATPGTAKEPDWLTEAGREIFSLAMSLKCEQSFFRDLTCFENKMIEMKLIKG